MDGGLHDKLRLPVTDLSPIVDPARLGFTTTVDVPPLEEPIGQSRAAEAFDFGLRIASPGFNIYVSGPTGSGKWTMAKTMVRRMARAAAPALDWCYVHNFQDPSRPRCLSFPAGQGRAFKEVMSGLLTGLRRDLPKIFESATYVEAKARILDETESRKKALFRDLTRLFRDRGFNFEELPAGFNLVPLLDGRPLTDEDKERLTDREKQQLLDRRKAVESDMREFHVNIHRLDHEAEQRMQEMDRNVVKNALIGRFEALRRAYEGQTEVLDYLDCLHEDLLQNYKDFLVPESPVLLLPGLGPRQPDFARYGVNLIVEHASNGGAPVVEESHPSYVNLVGKIERKAHMGVVFSDFTDIKAGAILQASGGYLIVSALDLLRQPFAWEALKRVIKTREITIEDAGEMLGFSGTGLRPQPIPVNVKVVMVGPPVLYHLLQAYEEDFQKIFKVKADFDVDVKRDDDQDRLYARLVSKLCRDEALPHFNAQAVAEVIRHGARLAERYDRLSLRISQLGDTIREAAFWARQEGRSVVGREDVDTAIANKRHRASLPEHWVQDGIQEGTVLVDLEGEQIGQVNGLSVHLLGDYAFGRPCRITARAFIGTEGVIDIQREAELSGHVHSKGVLTLAGYLAGKFAGSHPFALNATLTFEQTYSEVEGDSAAAAELATILSSLAEVPLRQSLAVTGSINQLGEVQPIGGVNEKIEGFFESCRRRGLTGAQGVIIPERNKKHLALREDVVEAVAAGTFSIFAVRTIEETLELLTGLPAGERGADGRYPAESLFGRVAARLQEMAKIVTEWSEPQKKLNDER